MINPPRTLAEFALNMAGDSAPPQELCRTVNRAAATRSQIPADVMLKLFLAPDAMPRRDWFTRLGQVWDLSLQSVYCHLYAEIFNEATREELDFMMTPAERAALKAMPALILVFRGCHQFNKNGLSWTTSPAIATAFASSTLSVSRDPGITPLSLKGFVQKDRAVYKDNGLQEIIATEVRVVSVKPYKGAPFGASAVKPRRFARSARR